MKKKRPVPRGHARRIARANVNWTAYYSAKDADVHARWRDYVRSGKERP